MKRIRQSENADKNGFLVIVLNLLHKSVFIRVFTK